MWKCQITAHVWSSWVSWGRSGLLRAHSERNNIAAIKTLTGSQEEDLGARIWWSDGLPVAAQLRSCGPAGESAVLPEGCWARQLWSTGCHTGSGVHQKCSNFNLELMQLSNEVGSCFTYELSYG